jgi:hypothetical protein
MSNKYTETKKPQNKNFPKIIIEASLPQNDSRIFQVFFLNQNESESVEVLETNFIDFEEISHRLNNGESIFIKNKNQEPIKPYSNVNDENNSSWYFNRC